MIKVIGFNYSKGNYQGFDYDNVVLHCITDTDTRVQGQSAVHIKIKNAAFVKIAGCNPEDLIGHCVDMNYIYIGTRPDLYKIVKLDKNGN